MHDAALPQSLPLCVRSTDALRIYGNFLAAVQAAAATPTSAGGHWPPDRGENASPFSLSLSLSSLSMYSEHGVKDTRRCFNSIFRYYPKERGNLDGPP